MLGGRARGVLRASLACAALCAARAGAGAPLSPEERDVLALQICLDRRGFSCNVLDGQCGRKTQVALATYCAVNGRVGVAPGAERTAWRRLFPGETNLFETAVVTTADRAACVRLPAAPAEKAKLAAMGYESVEEMFAERGHCSAALLRRLNPALAWPNPPAGARVVLPRTAPVRSPGASRRFPHGEASVLRVSLARMEITAFDAAGRLIGLFPCSIAAEKGKRPAAGELQVTTLVPRPNYTYTVPGAGRRMRYIYPPGPNNPVGTSWIGLSLPTYGIHGTPSPERIGRAESHGCFRLANWNAERLRSMCEVGTSVVVE